MKSKKSPQVDSWREAVSLVIAYVKQETVAPLRGIGRFVAYGMAASICFALASVFFVLSLLRALQTETGSTFTGSLTWVPYLLTLVLAGVIAGLAGWAVFSVKRRHDRSRKKPA